MATNITGGPGSTTGANSLASMEQPKLKLGVLLTSPNLCDHLDDEYVDGVGALLQQRYMQDKSSRSAWEDRSAKIMELAMQIVDKKSFPWVNASNVKFPLLTIAALQYHARAYPKLVPAEGVAKYQVFGPDIDGKKNALGKMIAQHLNWQLMENDPVWEEDMDRALLLQPIIGCVFKKTYYDVVKRRNVSEIVYPMDLVVNYYTKSFEDAPAVTHLIRRTNNEIHERVMLGIYRDVDLSTPSADAMPTGPMQNAQDKSQGLTPPPNGDNMPYTFGEQLCLLDLDGDGYKEPYIATFDIRSGKMLRLVARFDDSGVSFTPAGKVISIQASQYYTKIPFVPSPDGGFYDIGFGHLLFPINSSIDTIINQLIDSGTLANTAGGFLGKGIKMRGGQFLFKPFGWTPIDSVGDDIRKNIFPLPVREPSTVLFNLLNLLINYGERTGSAPEMSSGVTPGQNTPAETSRNAQANGERVLNAIMKRTYRAMKSELQKLYNLNAAYLDEMPINPFGATSEWYKMDPNGIRPAADPAMLSDATAQQQAEMLAQASTTAPGYNLYAVQRRRLEAWKVPNIDEVLPDPKGPNAIQPPPNPKLMDAETRQAEAKRKAMETKAKIEKMLAETAVKIEKADAEIQNILAQAEEHKAKAAGVGAGHAIALLNAQLSTVNQGKELELKHSAELRSILEMVLNTHKELTDANSQEQAGQNSPGNVGAVAKQPSNPGGAPTP